MTEDERKRVTDCLEYQLDHGHVRGPDEWFMFQMMERGEVGMDGFKYCWPEQAKEARRRTLAALSNPQRFPDRRRMA